MDRLDEDEPIRGGNYLRTGDSLGESDVVKVLRGKLRNECLNGEIFYSLTEVQIVIEQ